MVFIMQTIFQNSFSCIKINPSQLWSSLPTHVELEMDILNSESRQFDGP